MLLQDKFKPKKLNCSRLRIGVDDEPHSESALVVSPEVYGLFEVSIWLLEC